MVHDADAFEVWYRGLHPSLVASLEAAFGDPDLAREAADEAIVRAWERWRRVAAMDSPEGWIYRVAFNVARRRARRGVLERRLVAGRSVNGTVDGPAGEIWQLVQALPPRQRAAVVLRHVADLPEAGIAAAMGISRGGVSSTLRAAYRSMRRDLAPPEPDKEQMHATGP